MENRLKVIATVINDTVYDQRMIRICTSLAKDYEVSLWGRKQSKSAPPKRSFTQRRFLFLLSSGPLFYVAYNFRIFCCLLVAKVDILHAVDLDTLPACFLVSKLRNKKLIYDAHEYFTEVPELVTRPRKRAIWVYLEKIILPHIKQAITVGQMIAKEYESKYGLSFSVVRNVPVLQSSSPRPASKKYLLYQGALNKGRGLEALIAAMQDIDIELQIAGSGDLDEELRALARSLNVDHKIVFLGMLAPQDLSPLTLGAFAGVNVSENLGLSYFYSLNNKYFDYINAGLPAITNPFPEYVNLDKIHNCSVFANAHPADIARAANLLLANKELYADLKKNCLLARKKLNWTEEEKKLQQVYARIA